ncbi:MAG: hypothetical protein FJ279_04545 [Planctomycetes bacterium]|nr:hypothetical protein [Planctomycetota bacterium]
MGLVILGSLTAGLSSGQGNAAGQPQASSPRATSSRTGKFLSLHFGRVETEWMVEAAKQVDMMLFSANNDWDQRDEGEILLNGHRVDLPISKASNGRDHEFPPHPVPVEWLRPGANEVKFLHKATAGFVAKRVVLLMEVPHSRAKAN